MDWKRSAPSPERTSAGVDRRWTPSTVTGARVERRRDEGRAPGSLTPGSPASLTSAIRSPSASQRDELCGPLGLVVLVVAQQLRLDAMAVEQHARDTRVLAQAPLGARSSSSTRSVTSSRLPIGGRADGQRHRYAPSSASNPTNPAPTTPAPAPSVAATTHELAAGRQRLAQHHLSRRLEQELAAPRPTPRRDDQLGVEDVHATRTRIPRRRPIRYGCRARARCPRAHDRAAPACRHPAQHRLASAVAARPSRRPPGGLAPCRFPGTDARRARSRRARARLRRRARRGGTSVEDRTAADTVPSVNMSRSRVPPGAGLPLADRGGVRVVVDPARQSKRRRPASEGASSAGCSPTRPRCGCLVDRRGHAEADRCDAFADEALDHRADRSDDGLLQDKVGVGTSRSDSTLPALSTSPAAILVPPGRRR